MGSTAQFDDITMLCLDFKGPEKPVKECKMTADLDGIPKAIAFVEQELQRMECPAKTQSLLSVAVDLEFPGILLTVASNDPRKFKGRWK